MSNDEITQLKAIYKNFNFDLIIHKIFGDKQSGDLLPNIINLQSISNPDLAIKSGKGLNSILFKFLNDNNAKDEDAETTLGMKNWFKSLSRNINETTALKDLLSILWYSKLPCFDVQGISSEFQGEKSTVKSCWWKGKAMSCSAIFQKVATDNGICCGFNKPAADKIFVDSAYSSVIRDLADEEKK